VAATGSGSPAASALVLRGLADLPVCVFPHILTTPIS
jgi:hypothetical protein